METIECSKCGAIFEKTGAKDKLRRFKDKRFMTTFHCPNCDARVILKNGDEPISIYLKRLEQLKEQARRLGDRQEVNELQEEIDQIHREIKMNAEKTKDKKFFVKSRDAELSKNDPAIKHQIAIAKKTLKMPDAMAGVMGGMTKAEAKEILKKYGVSEDTAYDPTKPKNIAAADVKDSLFKGQKVTAIKSEQGLREGEAYTVLGEDKIIKQIVGENDEVVYKLQDSSGNIIVIGNPDGLFYEVKDVKNYMGERSFRTYEAWKRACKEINPNVIFEGNKDICQAKPGIGEWDGNEGIIYNKDSKTKDDSLKVKIGDIRKNMDAAKKMGFDTAPYQKEIDKLETKTKDDNNKNGYYAGMTGKARTDNPFTKGTPEYTKWDSDWKIGNEDFKYESNKELFKPKDSDDKELKEMLVNDAPDYYGAIVATARRGNNPRMGSKEVRKNLEPFMSAHGVQFNEEEFNKAYKEFNKAGVSKAAFMKGTDADDIYTKDPLTKKGEKILAAMKKAYGEEKGEQIFYAARNKGKISGVDAKGDVSYYKHFNITETGMGDFFAELDPAIAKSYTGKPYFTGRSMIEVKSLIDQWSQAHKFEQRSGKSTDSKVKDKVMDCPNCKNPLTYAGEENGKTKYECGLCGKKFVSKDYKAKDERIDRKFIASCPACQEMKKYGLSYEETHSSHTPGKLLVEVDGREREIPNPHIVRDSKTKDQEIKIIIGEDPADSNPAEQKVESNDVIYKEYTLKQLPETGEFEIYAPGGSIVGHAKALELAKLFVDRVVASKVE